MKYLNCIQVTFVVPDICGGALNEGEIRPHSVDCRLYYSWLGLDGNNDRADLSAGNDAAGSEVYHSYQML
ncbi:hypothetical protein PSSHI_18470 [Photobacterium sp. R1]